MSGPTHRATRPWADTPRRPASGRTVSTPKPGFVQGDGPAEGNWRARAACRTEDPELFFPVGNAGPALVQTQDAKIVCRRCPVIERCLRWAIETGQGDGVWGGTTPGDRAALKRRALREKTRRAA